MSLNWGPQPIYTDHPIYGTVYSKSVKIATYKGWKLFWYSLGDPSWQAVPTENLNPKLMYPAIRADSEEELIAKLDN